MSDCSLCKYNDKNDGCVWMYMGSGNPKDVPCDMPELRKEDEEVSE